MQPYHTCIFYSTLVSHDNLLYYANTNNKSLLPNVRLRLKSGSTLSSPVNNNVAATHNNDTNKLSQFQLKDPSRTILMRVEELTAFQLQEKEEKKNDET